MTNKSYCDECIRQTLISSFTSSFTSRSLTDTVTHSCKYTHSLIISPFLHTALRNSSSCEGAGAQMYVRASDFANGDVVSLLDWANYQFQLLLPRVRWWLFNIYSIFAISIFHGHPNHTRYFHPIHHDCVGGSIVCRSWEWSSFFIFMRHTHWRKRFIKKRSLWAIPNRWITR